MQNDDTDDAKDTGWHEQPGEKAVTGMPRSLHLQVVKTTTLTESVTVMQRSTTRKRDGTHLCGCLLHLVCKECHELLDVSWYHRWAA